MTHGTPQFERASAVGESTPQLLYVSFEALVEGVAAHVHVNEILAGLERRGWQTERISPAPPPPGLRGMLTRLVRVWTLNRKAARGLAAGRIVYMRANPLLLPLSWLAWRRGLPTVQECNGPYGSIVSAHPAVRLVLPLLAAAQRWQFRRAQSVVAGTHELVEWVRKERGEAGIHLISNGANTELFTPEAAASPPCEAPYVVYFGALTPWHGIDTMLAATRDPAWPAGVRLVLIGKGMKSREVEAAAQASDRIIALGVRPYRSVPGLIVKARAALIATEKFADGEAGLAPLKLFESLAAGLPAVVSDYPGQADFIRANRCGIVVPPRDPSAMARAIAQIVRDPAAARAMGESGRAAVVREHSWDHRAGQVDEMLRGLVQAKD